MSLALFYWSIITQWIICSCMHALFMDVQNLTSSPSLVVATCILHTCASFRFSMRERAVGSQTWHTLPRFRASSSSLRLFRLANWCCASVPSTYAWRRQIWGGHAASLHRRCSMSSPLWLPPFVGHISLRQLVFHLTMLFIYYYFVFFVFMTHLILDFIIHLMISQQSTDIA